MERKGSGNSTTIISNKRPILDSGNFRVESIKIKNGDATQHGFVITN